MILRGASVLAIVLTVAACGGNDDRDGPDVAAEYVGVYNSNCFADPSNAVYRYREAVTIKKTSDTVLSYEGSVSTYTNADCSGAADDSDPYAGTITILGSKAIGSDTVDTAAVTPTDQDSMKNVLAFRNGILVFGKKDSAVDSSGYYGELDGNERFAVAK